ncbi:sensor histidine kinase KdpD [Oceanobacillus sp. J11TS1]|uniref:sensor histidine kinase n=1 Tax=Oceanobacillus sp. J11TS1 TaxID=2807191 RepID=UPI001AFE4612|nr:HAMP domain-containing sensor histidine kinase [Oceanobacillus sp. J11TS1]GIO25222.1 two-component sensor histidine kinase [Oceanobacillus sp. J11TS1]
MALKTKTISLRKALFHYIMQITIGVVAVVVLFVVLLELGTITGVILPANYSEQIVKSLEPRIESGGEVTDHMMPRGVSFAVLDKQKLQKTYGTLSNQELGKVRDRFKKHDTDYFTGQKVYRVIERKDDYVVFQYYLRPQFKSTFMQKHFPNFETVSVIALIAGIILVIIVLTTAFANRLRKQVNKLTVITSHIKNRNLDYMEDYSSIKEFNGVIQSLGEMSKSLRISLETQWKMEKEKKEQIGALAHDIKIPITIIKGNAELLQMTDQTHEQAAFSKYILDAGNRIEKYTMELISITKSEMETKFEPSIVQIGPFIETLLKETSAYMGEKPIELTFHKTAEIREALMDIETMHRAFMNILVNAVDNTPEQGKIHFEVSNDKDYILFQIIDSGKGFSENGLRNADELFFMEDESRSADGHYGVGLSFVKHVVSLHKGKLRLQNNKIDSGGMVSVKIPVSSL